MTEDAAIAMKLFSVTADNQWLASELKDCCNELCLRCGDYRNEHKGACDGCRWKAVRHGESHRPQGGDDA